MKDMLFAWKIVKHVKSNGIAIAKDGQSYGMGVGQGEPHMGGAAGH